MFPGNAGGTAADRSTDSDKRFTKGRVFRQSLLHQQIVISVGKYQSDRLSLEIRKLRERIEEQSNAPSDTMETILGDCRALLEELTKLIQKNNERNL